MEIGYQFGSIRRARGSSVSCGIRIRGAARRHRETPRSPLSFTSPPPSTPSSRLKERADTGADVCHANLPRAGRSSARPSPSTPPLPNSITRVLPPSVELPRDAGRFLSKCYRSAIREIGVSVTPRTDLPFRGASLRSSRRPR